MKKFEVAISEDAEKELGAIYDFIARADCVEQAGRIQDELMDAILTLEKLPGRGKCPQEMLILGISEYREIQCPPWRIFYYSNQDRVGVVAVLDGRRDINVLLQRRLLH